MATGLEELIAGISRSPRSASITPTSAKALNKITKNNLATPPPSTQFSQQQQQQQEEEEQEEVGSGSDSEIEQKHNEEPQEEEEQEETKEAPVTPPPRHKQKKVMAPNAPRKAKRHIRQEQERSNTEFSKELLEKQFPESRIRKILKRGGAVSCVWSVADEHQLGIKDIIRLGVLARNASLLTKCAEVASNKQYNSNGDPKVKVDKDDPSIIDDATKHNYKIRLQDVIEACSLKNATVYSDETFPSTNTTNTNTKKNKDASVSKEEKEKQNDDDDDDEKENISPRAAKKQKV